MKKAIQTCATGSFLTQLYISYCSLNCALSDSTISVIYFSGQKEQQHWKNLPSLLGEVQTFTRGGNFEDLLLGVNPLESNNMCPLVNDNTCVQMLKTDLYET